MKIKKHSTLFIFIALTLLIFAFSWKENILFTDEILFEEAAYQMIQTSDFLTPQQQGEVWLEKPPLYFWLTAAIFKLASPSPFTRRLVTLITASATLALTYKLALHFYSKKIAHWAMFILTTTPLFLYFTKAANLDIPAAFFTAATIFTYLKSKKEPKWLLISGVTLGLGILTRSFLALTPIPVIALDQLLISKQKIPFRFLTLSLALSLTLSLPWHLYVFKKHPQTFMEQYLKFNITSHLIEQTPGHQPLPAPKFLLYVLFAYNPLALLMLGNLLPKPNTKKQKYNLFSIWAASVLFPLSLATTRHEWYAIQALPPIAILSSQGLIRLQKYLKPRLKTRAQEILKIYSLSILITLPIVVFLNMPKEAKAVILLKQFLSLTPENTPLYNLEYQFTPQSTLFNPRETPIIKPKELEQIKTSIYLYTDNDQQYDLAREKVQVCCNHSVKIEHNEAKIIQITPLSPK
jgi:4-amino-4-deoxy-L-arabinose transferase-like glycosyltransferase